MKNSNFLVTNQTSEENLLPTSLNTPNIQEQVNAFSKLIYDNLPSDLQNDIDYIRFGWKYHPSLNKIVPFIDITGK